MKLTVAFKLCPDLDRLPAGSINVDEEMGIDTHFLPNILNCYDESALEFGLRISESKYPVEKTAITLGGEFCEQPLRTLMALGYDRAIRVKADEQVIRFNPECVAATIASFIKQNPADIVILGREAPPGNNGVTAQLVSYLTGYPLIPSVIDISAIGPFDADISFFINGNVYTQKVRYPVVLSMGNAVISKLRVPSLKARMACKSREIEYYDLQESINSRYPLAQTLHVVDRGREGYLSSEKGASALEDVLNHSLGERLGLL